MKSLAVRYQRADGPAGGRAGGQAGRHRIMRAHMPACVRPACMDPFLCSGTAYVGEDGDFKASGGGGQVYFISYERQRSPR